MNWPYTKRQDGKIAINLDSNVWDFLFERNITLSNELPTDEFAIFVTREVEIEKLTIPNDISKTPLKKFIEETIVACGIETTSVFGFFVSGQTHQRVGGFDQGTWQSETERQYYAAMPKNYLAGKKPKNSTLTTNEGDAAVGAQSFFSIVLTCEKPKKPGPLRFAAEHGGKILYLGDFDNSGLTLKEFIIAFYKKI
jgi:hypothetical protein